MSSGHVDSSKQVSILTDVTKCVGCQKCVMACVKQNNTGDPVPYKYNHPDGLSGTRWTSVLRVRDEENDISRFVRKQCLHCVDPSCVSACLVGALKKRESGAVVYNDKKCIGCRYCMLACPYSIPRYDWDTATPFVQKCSLCFERLEEGKKPACTTACPYGATISGTREEMLAEARHRIKNSPDLYIPRIWGEHEFGGTQVLYLSDVPLEKLGFPAELTKANTISIPAANWPVVTKTPYILFGMPVALFSINWVIQRRMELAKKNQSDEKKDYEEII